MRFLSIKVLCQNPPTKGKRRGLLSLVKHYHGLNGSKGQNTAKNPPGILEVYNAQVNTSPFSCYFVDKVLDRHINVVLQAEWMNFDCAWALLSRCWSHTFPSHLERDRFSLISSPRQVFLFLFLALTSKLFQKYSEFASNAKFRA